MSVLKIDTDRYVEAATLAGTAGRGLADAVRSTHTVLARSGGMAGWDSMGTAWAGAYDSAARDVLEACQALALASSDTARALTFSAGNYISAEHVASMGVASFITPALPSWLPDTAAPYLPSAAEVKAGILPPEGWDIVEGLAGILWPAGDPALLRDAASAWDSLATGIDGEIDGPTQQAVMSLEDLMAADITLFEERSAEIRDCGSTIARQSRDIAGSCEALATAIESAHEELADETRLFIAEFLAMAVIGAIASFVTLGGAAAITSIIGAARVAQLVLRVQLVIARLTALTRGALVMASRLPGATRLASTLQALPRSPAAMRSATGTIGRSIASGAPRTYTALAKLAPAVRFTRRAGATAGRVLDSKAVSFALSNPAEVGMHVASRIIRKRLPGATAAQGSATDQLISAAGRSARVGPLVAAAHGAWKVSEKVSSARDLTALPKSLQERYAPTTPGELSSNAAGPGRLTAVRESPVVGPTAGSSRDRRTSHPAASP